MKLVSIFVIGIVLLVMLAFARSCYEVATADDQDPGYFDIR